MKYFYTTLLILYIAVQVGFSQTYSYLGTFNSQGVPNYLETRDVLGTGFVQRVNASLPERYPVPSYNPQYIATGTESNIVLNDEADVWVTFVAEGAGYLNTLGFYTFNSANPPTTAPTGTNIKIIFPNVSAIGSGGGLTAGDKVKIGRFPAGTGIGWVLISNAWNSGSSQVGNGIARLYSTPSYNPEASASLRYHNVLLNDEATQRVVLGFEDIRRDLSNCDNDFNDAIFYITASSATAIARENYNSTVLVQGSISSGNDGGLESEGTLADKITKRNVEKGLINKKAERNEMKNMKAFEVSNTNAINSLSSIVPYLGPDSSSSFVSTPLDLLEITNAVDVLSVDYFKNTERFAVCLLTKTENEVYSHTKNICDRVSGSSIEAIKYVMIGGEFPASLITIKQNNGAMEYAISFSFRKMNEQLLEYNNHWNVENYASGSPYINIQVWGKMPSYVFYLAEQMIINIRANATIAETPNYTQAPAVIMRAGRYEQGKFKIAIYNRLKKHSNVRLSGTYRPTEVSTPESFSQEVALTGQVVQEVSFDTRGVFDSGLNLDDLSNNTRDAIYLADGAWIANYEPTNVGANTLLKVFPQDNLDNSSVRYYIERGFEASGTVRNYYSVHRPLRLGLRTVNLSDFNYLSFTASGNRTIEIVVSREGITNWSDQPRKYVTLSDTTKRYYLNLSDFKDSHGVVLQKNDINAITFSVISNNQTFVPFDLKINQLAFTNSTQCDTNQQVLVTTYSAEKFESRGVLTALNVNKANSAVIMSAENAIDFKPGFIVESRGSFKANIKQCDH